MYETEYPRGGVCADHDAGVAYDMFAVAAAEEDEVAGHEVAGVAHLDAEFGLGAAPARQVVAEVTVEEQGEAGAVEAFGTAAAVTIAGAEILFGHANKHKSGVGLMNDDGREVGGDGRKVGGHWRQVPAVVMHRLLCLQGYEKETKYNE